MKNRYEIRGDVTAILCEWRGSTWETLIDTVDLERIIPFVSVYLREEVPERIYAMGYLGSVPKPKHVALSRFILGDQLGPGMLADHKDHNTLDNRRANLRPATPGEA